MQMSGEIMSILQALLTEAILNEKCHMNMGQIYNDYGDMGILDVASLVEVFIIYLFTYLLKRLYSSV
jgi:hypothetical protein